MLSINWRRFYVSRETSANVYIGVFRILACILQVGAWYLAHVKNDIMLPSSTFIASTRHLLPEVYVCEMIEVLTFLPKSLDICFLCIFRANFLVNYFHPKNLNKINRLQLFFIFQIFGMGDAIPYYEREHKPPIYGRIGWFPIINQCSIFNGAVFNIRFHMPRNLWKRLAWRQGGLKFPGD